MANAFTLFGEISVNTTKFMRDMDNAQKRLESFKKALGDAESVTGRTSNANDTYASSTKRVASAANTAESAIARTTKTVKTASIQMDDLAKKVGSAGDRMKSLGTAMTASITAPLTLLGRSLLESGKDVDSMMNQLIMATGSLDKAKIKFQEFLDLSRNSTGVFADVAIGMYGLLAPSVKNEKVITMLVQAMGKLKTAFAEMDVRSFVWNLTQIFNQGMEMMDLKQAFNFFPRFGEVIAEKFKINSSDAAAIQPVLKYMKETGKLTMETWLGAFAEAVNSDPKFALLTDTLGNRLQKAITEIKISGAPIGKVIGDILVSALRVLDKVLKDLSVRFSEASPAMQYFVVLSGMLAVAIGPVVIALGVLAGAVEDIIVLATRLGPVLTGIAEAFAGVGFAEIAVIVAGVAAALYVLYNAISLVSDWWNANVDGMKGYIEELYTTIDKIGGDILMSLKDTFGQIGDDIGADWEDFVNAAIDVAKILWVALRDLFKLIVGTLKYLWNNFGKDIVATLKTALEMIALVVGGLLNVLTGLFEVFIALATGDFERFKEGVSNIFRGLGKIIVGLLGGLFNTIIGGIKNFVKIVFSIFGANTGQAEEAGKKFGTSTGKGILDGLLSTFPAIKAFKDWVAGQVSAPTVTTNKPEESLFNYPALKIGALGGKKATGAKKEVEDGTELLRRLEEQYSRLNVTTKVGEVELDLYFQKLTKIKPEIREQILAFAGIIDSYNATQDAYKKQASALDGLIENLEKVPLAYDQLKSALGDTLFLEYLAKQTNRTTEELKKLIEYRMRVASLQDLGIAPINLENRKPFIPTPTQPIGPIQIPTVDVEPWMYFFDVISQGFKKMKEDFGSVEESLGRVFIDGLYNIGNVFAESISKWDGTLSGFFKSLASGFKSLVSEVLAELTRMMVMQAVMSLFGSLFGSLAKGNANSFFGKLATSMGGTVKKASGGLITGAGTGSSDSIPAMLSNGEFVIPASSVRRFGTTFFESLRRGMMPQMGMAYAQMPSVGAVSGNTTSTSNTNNVFNINVTGGTGGGQTASMVQQEIIKGLRKTEKRNR